MERILVVDSQRYMRNVLKERLDFEGYQTEVAETLEEAYEKHKMNSFTIVICEEKLATAFYSSSQDMTARREIIRDVFCIILSDSPSIEAAVHAIRDGAFDFVPKPVDMNYLFATIRNIIGNKDQLHGHTGCPRVDRVSGEEKIVRPVSGRRSRGKMWEDDIIGNSLQVNNMKSLIEKVAPCDARVLITGPNGTGKELVARWLHKKSNRCDGPFVEVNCAAIPSELIESELFGHEKGAFTSAVKLRKGKFEQADGGTLFLDEIGDMSASAQAKVLRALQEKKISRVGSDKDICVDVRVVAATNKNLRKEIDEGHFREDLYHRLSVIMINVPPLVERLDDIPLLVDHFVKNICKDYGISTKKVDKEALAELKKMDWTGNIRELRNVIERLVILSEDKITMYDVRTYAPCAI